MGRDRSDRWTDVGADPRTGGEAVEALVSPIERALLVVSVIVVSVFGTIAAAAYIIGFFLHEDPPAAITAIATGLTTMAISNLVVMARRKGK